jgi:hypothetical protein
MDVANGESIDFKLSFQTFAENLNRDHNQVPLLSNVCCLVAVGTEFCSCFSWK